MRILLVNPVDPQSLVSFSGVFDESDRTPLMPNLALPTLAALAPADCEVTIVDEQVTPIDFSGRWDVVGITGYANHRGRMREIAGEFRRRGQLVAIGGPFASLAPEELRDHADVLFVGEAERTWPRFLADLRAGRWQAEYRETTTVDLDESPLPAYPLLDNPRYLVGLVQTSRGCPFQCEFCDVIVYLGRKQRHKSPERVVAELEQLHCLGYREVFVADDNFTAHRRKSEAIVRAIAAWNETKPARMAWITQMSVDVARDQELLALCAQSGLVQAFVGIESSDPAALRETQKRQNLGRDLVGDVHAFYSHGIVVQAGIIVGFDADTTASFRRQYEFIQASAVPTITLNLLNAPHGTPLLRRMMAAGRVQTDYEFEDFSTPIVPVSMTIEELVNGARWLANKVYDPNSFLQRLERVAERLPDVDARAGGRLDAAQMRRGLAVWDGILAAYARLGPEFRAIVPRAFRLFRNKNKRILPTVLLQYKHVVANLQRRGVWNPALAAQEEPDFELPIAVRATGPESYGVAEQAQSTFLA